MSAPTFTARELPHLLDVSEKLAGVFGTFAEAQIFLRVALAEQEGEEITIGRVARVLDMPMSTTSRIVWELAERKLVRMSTAAGDRRKRTLKPGKAWQKLKAPPDA